MLSSCRIWELQTHRMELRESRLRPGKERWRGRTVKYVALTENAEWTLRWQTAQGGSREESLSVQIIKKGSGFANTPVRVGVIYRAEGGGESFFFLVVEWFPGMSQLLRNMMAVPERWAWKWTVRDECWHGLLSWDWNCNICECVCWK